MGEFTTILDLVGKASPLGLIVLFCWLVGSGKLVLKREFERERERAEKAEAALDTAMPVVQRAIEALNRAPEVTTTAVEAAAEMVKRRDGARGERDSLPFRVVC